tara:strand:+ start:3208 stop:3429 length:222 start_codon:yes stop_codon:yes gene_type:complete
MIKWRSIKEVGMPKDKSVGYLVTDGKNIEYSSLDIYEDKWIGGSVYALYEEVSETGFDFYPTHFCPVSELNLP